MLSQNSRKKKKENVTKTKNTVEEKEMNKSIVTVLP